MNALVLPSANCTRRRMRDSAGEILGGEHAGLGWPGGRSKHAVTLAECAPFRTRPPSPRAPSARLRASRIMDLPRAGFAREDGQPNGKAQVELIDQNNIADRQSG